MGWFTPSCPVTTYEKAWVETRLAWLANTLGIDRLLKAQVVEPTPAFFPESYTGTVADAEVMLGRLCEYMRVNRRAVELEVLHDHDMPGAAGQYVRPERGEHAVIRLAASQLNFQETVVATIAHELAHEILLGGEVLVGDEPDHEWVTDLLPVFLGLGIFATNVTVQESQGRSGDTFWWSFSKHGYLPMRVFAYALACFATIREEPQPAWAKFLRLDAATGVKAGIRYLRKTGDTLFTLKSCREARVKSVADATDRVRTGTPSNRLAALWELRSRQVRSPTVLPELLEALRGADADVVVAAVDLVSDYGRPAVGAYPSLADLLQANRGDVRAAAVTAMSKVTTTPDATAVELSNWLTDESQLVVFAVAEAVVRLGRALDADGVARILRRLEPACRAADDAMMDSLLLALRTASDDPVRDVEEYFNEVGDECRNELVLRLNPEYCESKDSDPSEF